jgi:hypothetical protein
MQRAREIATLSRVRTSLTVGIERRAQRSCERSLSGQELGVTCVEDALAGAELAFGPPP